jgi:hypothetical protein
MNHLDYLFIFSSYVDQSEKINTGRLALNTKNKDNKWTTPLIWSALSSIGTKQYFESWNMQGGLIPPQYRLIENKSYTVNLNPISMPNVKGVQGNFYKIDPYLVVTDKKKKRGDFGIHRDANVLGSLGCIVMSDDRFEDFERNIKELYDNGIKSIPLLIFYGG